jgi:hypothetical protein
VYPIEQLLDPRSWCQELQAHPRSSGNGALNQFLRLERCRVQRNVTGMRVGGSGTGSARVVVADDLIPEGWTKVGDFLIVDPDTKNPSSP